MLQQAGTDGDPQVTLREQPPPLTARALATLAQWKVLGAPQLLMLQASGPQCQADSVHWPPLVCGSGCQSPVLTEIWRVTPH